MQGFGGTKILNEVVELQKILLPEFSKSFQIEIIQALVIDDKPKYDLIVGRDVLKSTGFMIDFDNGLIKWLNMQVPMKKNMESEIMYVEYMSDEEDMEELFVTEIKSSKDDEIEPSEVANDQDHLNESRKQEERPDGTSISLSIVIQW